MLVKSIVGSGSVKEILACLFGNGRMTYTELGKRTGRDRSNVKKVVNRMEDERVIWNYCPVVDVRKLGLKTFIILFRYGSKSNHKVVAESMKSEAYNNNNNNNLDNQIVFVDSALCHGSFDFHSTLLARDVIVVRKLVDRLKESYPDFISETEILEVILPVRICGNINPELESDIVNVLE